jgi:hypothetical protein
LRTSETLAGDLVKGAAAGAGAVWIMDRLDWWMVEHEDPRSWQRSQEVRPNHQDPAHALAGMAAEAVGLDPPSQPHPAGIAVHYAIGMAPAALYAASRKHLPGGVVIRGLAYGLAMFLIEDEVLNPALGVAAPPQKYPWQAHARGLVAHLALGLATEAVLAALDPPKVGRAEPELS